MNPKPNQESSPIDPVRLSIELSALTREQYEALQNLRILACRKSRLTLTTNAG
jgi:hypothetical protein